MTDAICEEKFSDDPPADPLALFLGWLSLAEQHEPNDPGAACLATVDSGGHPSARMVLVKSFTAQGFCFHTNETSRKGSDLQQNPHAALCFHWKSLRKQVRIEGPVEYVDDSQADAYFTSRPRERQIGAWASRQSALLQSPAQFQEDIKSVEKRFAGQNVPRPPHWRGYCVIPMMIEFWQEMPHRLHERMVYKRDSIHEKWQAQRLYP